MPKKKNNSNFYKKQTTVALPKTYPIQTVIARVFDPPVMIALLTILAVALSKISSHGMIAFTFFLPFLFGLPLGYILWKLKTHQITNWDITNRKERIIPFLAFLGFLLLDCILVSLLQNQFLFELFLLYFLWMLGFFFLTLVFKISGHTGIITLAAGLLIEWFGWQIWPVIFIVPLVSWARVTRKDHSVFQAVAGIVYSLIILSVWKQLI